MSKVSLFQKALELILSSTKIEHDFLVLSK